MAGLPKEMTDLLERLEAQAATKGHPDLLPHQITREPGESTYDLVARRRETRGGSTSGYCIDAIRVEGFEGRIALARNPDEWHALCAGGSTNGAGKTSLCLCPCHDEVPACHLCKHPHSVDEAFDWDNRRCTDRGACASRIAENHRQYDRMNDAPDALKRIPAKSAAKQADAPEPGRVAPVVPKTPRKATKGVPQRCHCGCGAITKGGRFIAGHDMKLKGRLFADVRVPLVEVNQDDVNELVARGWSLTGIPPQAVEMAQQVHADMGEMNILKRCVFTRYNGVEGDIA